MKQVNGIWLPDHEEHLQRFAQGEFGKWTYQKAKLEAALKVCGKRRNQAIDVGAHCGLWSKEMVKSFGYVHAFEPVKEHRECWQLNVTADNASLYPFALGEKAGRCSMHKTEGASGCSWMVEGGSVEIKTLDYFDLAPDFLKIDTEGHELFVLKGGLRTLQKHKPVVCVEQKPGNASTNFGIGDTDAVKFLEDLGYQMLIELEGDFLMMHPKTLDLR